MIKRSLLPALCVTGMALATSSAFASDGTITFSGEITDNTCTISGNSGGTPSFTVNLPKVAASALQAAGDVAGATPFDIKLSGCSSAGKVYTYFERGPNVDTSTGDLKNTAAAHNASNLQVRVTNADDDSQINMALGASQNSHQVDIDATSKSATLKYYAKYIATDAVTAGAVSTFVTYSMAYE